jgi:GTP-binding protein
MTSKTRGHFVCSGAAVMDLPRTHCDEIAFAGRSNVGKSTLLGCVLQKPKLVRSSRTPGRTQLLNLFSYGDKLNLIDLPGYGYAKLPKSQRRKLDHMVQSYLQERQNLRGVILVVDSRRDPVSDYDHFVSRWVLETGQVLLLAITKIDQVPKNRRVHQIRRIENQLGMPKGVSVPCSGKTGEGRNELLRRILELCA